jgi:hypothetical protein
MGITIIRKPRIWRSYLVYDLEWVPGTLELRLVGVYDGERYRCYTTIDAFIANEMTSKNRGKWFYAHAGGLADFQFVLEALLKKRGYKVTASFSGSSAIIVHVTRGKNSWHFIDSYWLMRDSLRNIGKWVGIHKGNEEESVEWYATAPLAELITYNEQDCIILYRAIEFFEEVLLGLGGQLKMTQASSAMELFRRRFLKADIETSFAANEIARKAYFASRVEVITTQCEDALYYDVNSSFPYAMTFPCPGELLGTVKGRFPKAGYPLFLSDVIVEVPETYLPPLPTRFAGRLFFPCGIWRGWYSSIDIELLLAQGGKIHKVYQSLVFQPFEDLRDYATTLYDLRAKSEGFPKLAYKYLLNSLYGKFAESPEKRSLRINPETIGKGWTMLFPGAFLVESNVPVPHMHVPISVHITAIARRTLFNYMGVSSELHYCDTDGFSTTDTYLEDAKRLGALKLEKRLRHGRFVAAKVYDMDGTDDKGDLRTDILDAKGEVVAKGNRGIKAKGFSKMTLEKFERLLRSEDIEYTRMARIQELAREGVIKPRESLIRKRLRTETMSKRFFYPDGHSRPWWHDEIKDKLG